MSQVKSLPGNHCYLWARYRLTLRLISSEYRIITNPPFRTDIYVIRFIVNINEHLRGRCSITPPLYIP